MTDLWSLVVLMAKKWPHQAVFTPLTATTIGLATQLECCYKEITLLESKFPMTFSTVNSFPTF